MFKPFFFCCKFHHQNQFLAFLPTLCLFFSFVASSFSEGDIEGSFRIRAILPQTQSGSPPSLLTLGQLHIKGDFQPSNKLKTQVHFLSSNSYGQILSFEESIRIYPSGNWLISEDLELRLGRNIYESQFHQIVSINDYEPFFYTFDGVFLEYSTEILNVNFWSAYLPKRWIGGDQVQEFKYGFGFFLDIESVSDYIDYFNAHVAYLGDSFFKEESKKISRYGLGLEGTISPFDLAYTLVAVGHGNGIQFKPEENMYHFRMSYSHPEIFNSKIFVGYHTDSSQYNPWLYDRHENAGLLDIFLWGNLTYYFLGLSGSVLDLFDIQISFYDFSSTAKGTGLQAGYFGSLIKAENKNFAEYPDSGRELDVQIKKQIRKDFKIHLLAGLFVPQLNSQKFFKSKDFYSNIQLTGFYKF